MTAQAGRFPLDVVMLSTAGDVLGSFSLTLKVERAAINNGKIATYTYAGVVEAIRKGLLEVYITDDAKQCADKNPGYYVFDPAGKAVYPEPKSSVPYTVRVSIKDLNIRKGPGTNYGKTGYYTGKGVFTIVAESAGAGSAKGWGKLKSGAGWIALDFAARI